MMREYVVKVTDALVPDAFQRFENEWSPEQELVRCKDCVNCIKEPNRELYCDVLAIGYEPLGSKKVTEDWFCADGKRK